MLTTKEILESVIIFLYKTNELEACESLMEIYGKYHPDDIQLGVLH